jgi:hypothetical protein
MNQVGILVMKLLYDIKIAMWAIISNMPVVVPVFLLPFLIAEFALTGV